MGRVVLAGVVGAVAVLGALVAATTPALAGGSGAGGTGGAGIGGLGIDLLNVPVVGQELKSAADTAGGAG